MNFDVNAIGTIGNQIILIIGAIATLVGVITTSIMTLRTGQRAEAIRTLVDSKATELSARNEQLTELLSTTNVVIPTSKETEMGDGR